MGVKGLTTFFNQNPDLSKPYKLHDSPVIIDGCNLLFLLYYRYKIDCICGGDYNKYAASIRSYFSCFIECNIRPVVVLDGGYDKSDRKLKTILERAQKRLTGIQHIAKYGRCSEKVLPIIAHEVFRAVLLEMNIPFAQCDFEADDQITALANHYQCPVISDDSDFYIFDVHHGFIRLNSVEPHVITGKNDSGAPFNYLKCHIYHIDKFLSHFPGINKNVLPLFGTLIGNDFVNTKVFNNFFSNIHLPKYKSGGLKISPRQKKIIGLLCWLSHNDLNGAIDQVLLHLKKERRCYVKSIIDHAVEGYKIQKSILMYIVDNRIDDLKKELRLETKLTTPCGQALPVHFTVQFLSGQIPPFFLNVIILHRIFLPFQVEDVTLDSSFACSCFIRRVMYGVLLCHDVGGKECRSKECIRCIEEYDRRGASFHKECIEPIFSLNNLGTLPSLNEVYSLDRRTLRLIMLEVLGVQDSTLIPLPKEWQLVVGCIIYWLKNCSPGPNLEFLYAVIINVLYFGFINDPHSIKLEILQGESGNKENESRKKVCSIISNITESQLQFAAKNLKKYLQKPLFNNAHPLILHILHSFSQLQSCILFSVYLNKLLEFTFVHPRIHKMFSGTMLYNLAKEILSRPFPDLFVSELLGRESYLDKLFILLKEKVLDNVSMECFSKNDFQPRKKKRNKSNTKKNQSLKSNEDDSTVELSNKFDYLVSLFTED